MAAEYLKVVVMNVPGWIVDNVSVSTWALQASPSLQSASALVMVD